MSIERAWLHKLQQGYVPSWDTQALKASEPCWSRTYTPPRALARETAPQGDISGDSEFADAVLNFCLVVFVYMIIGGLGLMGLKALELNEQLTLWVGRLWLLSLAVAFVLVWIDHLLRKRRRRMEWEAFLQR